MSDLDVDSMLADAVDEYYEEKEFEECPICEDEEADDEDVCSCTYEEKEEAYAEQHAEDMARSAFDDRF